MSSSVLVLQKYISEIFLMELQREDCCRSALKDEKLLNELREETLL